jgi:hypothetical protein
VSAACGDAVGTARGRGRHQKAGEKPCDPCAVAWNAYQQAWRQRDPETAEKHRAMVTACVAARSRALTRLGREYRERYRELYREEKARGAS